jgi:hypothetical protein
MNISIDASTASPAALRLTAAILTFIAGFKENPQTAGLPIPQTLPIVTPSPSPAPPAPIAEPAPEITGAPQGEVDSRPPPSSSGIEGAPALRDSAEEMWNPEIHTANQSKNTDGTWRRKRTPKGEAPATPKTVELPKVPQVPQVPPPPPAPSVAVEPTTIVPPAPVATAAVPPVPSVSTASSSPLAELGGDTFGALVKYVTNLVGSKKVSTAAMLEACIECGVPDIHSCSKPENAAVIPLVAAALAKRAAK